MKKDYFDPLKVLYHYRKMADIVEGKRIAPVTVSIDPSAVCNQHCIFCSGTGYVNKKTAILERDIFFNLANSLHRMGIGSAWFTGGGEPLCNPHIAEAIVEFANKKIKLGMVTNGTLLNSSVIKNTIFLDWIRISVDASTASTYSLLHGTNENQFWNVLTNIEDVVRHKRDTSSMLNSSCVVGMSFVVHPKNYHEIYDFAVCAKNIGADYVQFKPLLTIDKWFSEDDMSKTIIHLMTKSRELETDDFQVLANFGRFQHVTTGYTRPYTECLGHNLIGIVMATGQLNICCHQRPRDNYAFGDLHRQTFEEIWFGKEHEKAIKNIRLSECPACKYEMYNQYLWAMKTPPAHAEFI